MTPEERVAEAKTKLSDIPLSEWDKVFADAIRAAVLEEREWTLAIVNGWLARLAISGHAHFVVKEISELISGAASSRPIAPATNPPQPALPESPQEQDTV